MSTIPTSVTQAQFEDYIYPYLSKAKRGYESRIGLFKVFNYVLKRIYMGCQWKALPIEADGQHPEKKN